MYGKKFRLPLSGQSGRLKKIFMSPYFMVKAAPNSEGHNRFGIIISNNSVKKSVERHFWKRRIAECLSIWQNFQEDFLFIVSPEIKNADAKIIRTEIKKVLYFLTSKIRRQAVH